MKNTKKQSNKILDVMAEARKSKKFQMYSRDAEVRILFAVEVYNTRESQGLSQQQLAKDIHSTQKVISRIEGGEVNVGIELINRIRKRLNLDLYKIFRCDIPVIFLLSGKGSEHENANINNDYRNIINFKTNSDTIEENSNTINK